MTKAYRSQGQSLEITGLSSGVKAGYIYRRSGGTTRYWVGVVTNDITGTSEALTTIDGRPIQIGDGVAAETQYGDGRGDMMVEGVFTIPVYPSGNAPSAVDGAPLYGSSFTNNVASGVDPTPGGHAISGTLVGFADGDAYIGTTAPYVGVHVVDVKLLGLPLHALQSVAP